MAYKTQESNTNLAWVAIILSIIALVFSFMVYSQNQGGFTKRDLQMQMQSLKQQKAVSKALQSMEELRAGVANGSIAVADVQTRMTIIRTDLSAAYMDASDTAKKSWQTLDELLSEIGKNLKGGTVTILDALDKAIVALKKQIQY